MIAGMNGFDTAQNDPLDCRTRSARTLDGNHGEKRVFGILAATGIREAPKRDAGVLDFRQQHAFGRYALDFAWPRLQIAIEADGSIHKSDATYQHDRLRDAWLRERGWLVFRVDTTLAGGLEVQVHRVLDVIRALAGT